LDSTARELADHVQVTIPDGTSIMVIKVTDPDAQAASSIAGAIGESLVDAVADLAPAANDGRELVRATVISPAGTALKTFPRIRYVLLIAAGAGLILGLGQAALRFNLDKRIHNDDDVADVTDAPVMGRIALDTAAEPDAVTPSTHGGEDFRRLRTNLQFIGQETKGQGQAFVVTSPLPGEGKTTVALRLATVLAQAGEHVLLIDADLRRPQIAKRLGLEGAVGLTTLLIGRAGEADVLQATAQNGLTVMASGSIPPNPSELLASATMTQVLAAARKIFRYIIIDTSPLLPVTDAAILAHQTDGALVIINSQKTTTPQLRAALESIDAAKGKVLGLIVNKIKRERRGYGSKYDYYYQYEYVADPSTGERTRSRRKAGHRSGPKQSG
jgi:capsular exopolysaccharide synthesis family protein